MTEHNLEQSIFLHAIGLATPMDRAAYLDQACRNRPELRAEIDALLAAHDHLGGAAPSLIQAEPTQAPCAPPAEGAGQAIGPYKLLEQIGEGGMGVVWMAEQKEPIHRRVALKVIKAGMDSKQVLARFEAERQALALMDHPNIARVLDAGVTGTGRPYFVMELVKGAPITQYCDDKHLSVRERLELFSDVCRAVQHAHQKGIIHRDLKPSNILIAPYDGKPVVKVIDFGVAKATGQRLTDATLFTGFGAVVGTPEYMSPEQAETNNQDIDTRSDIYSLGVLLYELLTGSTPLTKKRVKEVALLEVLRVIREEEPPKPSTRLSSTEELPSISAQRHTEPAKLTSLVRGELDWIVMKALEKDRNRRYETANGFALDIQRHLADEPVQACPPSAAYRFRKFVRRNKATLATSTMFAAALVAGIIGTSWQAVRATREADRATYEANAAKSARTAALDARNTARQKEAEAIAALEQVELQRQQANKNFDKARRAVDEYLTQVTESELLTVPGLQPLREDLLQAALKFYAEFTQERAEDPTLHRELASAHHRLAKIQSDLGNAAAAKAANLEAIRVFEQLRGQDAESVDLQADLASAYFFAGRYDDTVKLCRAVLQIQPKHVEIRSLLADTYNELAVADKTYGAVALKYHQQAFELRDALVRDFPENPRYLAQSSGTINNLGNLLSRQGKREQALAMFERAVEYSAQAYERAPHSLLWGRWLCVQLRNVASHQVQLDKQDEALRSYERLVAICRKRAFENPALGTLRGDLCQAYLDLGKHQKRLGDMAEGARSFRLAREILEQIPRETPDQLMELAMVYAVLARPAKSLESEEVDEAERQRNADLAVETLRKAVEAGYQNASVLATNTDLDVLRGRDDFRALLTTVQKLAEADRLVKANDANASEKLSSHQQAAELLKGLASSQPGHVPHRATLAATLHSIGVIQTGLKQFDEAGKTLDEVLRLRQEIVREQSGNPLAKVDVLSTRAAIGQLDWERDRPEDAHRAWQDVVTQGRQLAAEHQGHTTLPVAIADLEWSIAQKYGELGLWELASDPVDQILKNRQLYHPSRDDRGLSLLAALGRFDKHQQLCQLIAERGDNDPLEVVWGASMNPQPALDGEQLLKLAEKALESAANPFTRVQAATGFFRSGRMDQAFEVLVAERDQVATYRRSAYPHWYAIVYHRLGHKEEAARHFERAEANYVRTAERILRNPEKSAVKDVYDGRWWMWTEDQAVRRAAWSELHPAESFQDPWPHLIQARAYRAIGEMEKSEAEVAAAVAAAPDAPAMWTARARLFDRWDEQQGKLDLTGQGVTDETLPMALKRAPPAHLVLEGSGITDASLPLVAQIDGLKRLALHGASVTNEGLAALANADSLDQLELSRMPDVTGDAVAHVAKIPNLKSFIAKSTGIYGPGLEHLRDRGIRRLQIESEQLDSDMLREYVLPFGQLTALGLWNTRITDEDVALIAKRMTVTGSLHLGYNPNLTGAALKHIHEMPELASLSLGGEQFDDQAMTQLAGATHLQRLELAHASVGDGSIDALGTLTRLHELRSSDTNFTKEGLARLKQRLPQAAIVAGHPDSWAASDIRILHEFKGHTGPIKAVAFSPDGKRVISGSGWPEGDGTVRLWNAATGEQIRTLGSAGPPIMDVAFSPDGKWAAGAGFGRVVHVWDVEAGEEIFALKGHSGDVDAVAFSPDGRMLLSAGKRTPRGGEARGWSLQTGEELWRFDSEGWLMTAAYLPDGERVVVSGFEQATAPHILDAKTGDELPRRNRRGHGMYDVEAIAISADGGTIAGVGATGALWLWNVENGELLVERPLDDKRLLSVAFSPDETRLFVGGHAGKLHVLDAATWETLASIDHPGGSVWAIAFAPDGQHALTAGGTTTNDPVKPNGDYALRLWRLPE